MSKKILLVKHPYGGGAAHVLNQLEEILEERGYSCIEVQEPVSRDTLVASDLVICNTLLTYDTTLRCHEIGVPTAWWLHEGEWAKEQLWQTGMVHAYGLATTVVVSTEYMKGIHHLGHQAQVIKYATPETPEHRNTIHHISQIHDVWNCGVEEGI